LITSGGTKTNRGNFEHFLLLSSSSSFSSAAQLHIINRKYSTPRFGLHSLCLCLFDYPHRYGEGKCVTRRRESRNTLPHVLTRTFAQMTFSRAAVPLHTPAYRSVRTHAQEAHLLLTAEGRFVRGHSPHRIHQAPHHHLLRRKTDAAVAALPAAAAPLPRSFFSVALRGPQSSCAALLRRWPCHP